MTEPEPQIQFTIFSNNKDILTKRAQRLPDDNLKKIGATDLFDGTFETVSIPFSDLGGVLEGLRNNQALALGTSVDGASGGPIATKDMVAAGLGPDGARARAKTQFGWSGNGDQILFLDFDNISEDVVAGLGVEDAMGAVLSRFLEVCPAFKAYDFWLRPSSGSYIYDLKNEGKEISNLTGMHAYFRIGYNFTVENEVGLTGKIEEVSPQKILQRYVKACCAHAGIELGFHFEIAGGDSARVLDRYPIDLSVLNASRLIYAYGMYCDEKCGFEQRYREALFWEREETIVESGIGSGLRKLFTLTQAYEGAARGIIDKAKREFRIANNIVGLQSKRDEAKASRTGLHVSVVRQHREMAEPGPGGEPGKLSGIHEVLMDNGELIKAWRFIIDFEEFDGKTCRDPWEPEYHDGAENKAIIYSKGLEDGAIVWSLAHGERCLKVLLDYNSVIDIVEFFNKGRTDGRGMEELVDILGPSWSLIMRDLNASEQDAVLERLKELKWISGVARTKLAYGMAMENTEGKKAWAKLEAAMEELNRYYAEIEIGSNGEIRILRTIPDEIEETSIEEVLEARSLKESGKGIEGTALDQKRKKIQAGAGGYGHQHPADFRQKHNKKFRVWIDGKEKLVKLGDMWLDWSGRRKYCQLIYRPDIKTREIPVSFNGGGELAFNLFEGFAIEAHRTKDRACGEAGAGRNCISCFFGEGAGISECRPFSVCKWHQDRVGGGITAWLMHIHECVAGGKVDDTRWILDWFANIFQNPGETGEGGRVGKALAVYGSGFGTGKSGLADPIKMMLGLRTNCFTTADTELLIGRFNSGIEGRLLIHAEEALWRDGKNASSKLKHLITGRTVPIERKGIDINEINNHARLYVSSNELKAVPVVPGERRFAVFRILEHKRSDKNWFKRFLGAAAESFYGEWFDCLMQWKIESELYIVPDTEGLRSQKMMGLKELPHLGFIEWCIENKFFWKDYDEDDDDGTGGVVIDVPDFMIKNRAIAEGFVRGFADYQSFAAKFWDELRNLGVSWDKSKLKRFNEDRGREVTLHQCHKDVLALWENKMHENTK